MKDYFPCYLNSESVHATFKACVADYESKEIIKCVLFRKENGFPSDSKPILFDKELLEARIPKLEYMLGQLKDVHNTQKRTNTTDIKIKYDNTVWAENNQALLEFLHMCCAANLISPLRQNDSSIEFLTDLYPTISPNDPDYSKWRKENKPKIMSLIASQKD